MTARATYGKKAPPAEKERADAGKKGAPARQAELQADMEELMQQLRETQHLLEQSRDSYADLYDYAPLGYVTIAANGQIIERNITFARMVGYDHSKLRDLPFNIFVASPADLNLFLSHLDRCRRTGEHVTTELRLKHRDGSIIESQLFSVAVPDYTSRSLLYRTAIIDVTERKRAEESRDATKRQLQLVMDTAPVPIAYVDREGRFLVVNAAYARKLRTTMDAVAGRTFREVHGEDFYRAVSDRLEKGLAGEPAKFEGRVACAGCLLDNLYLRLDLAPDFAPEGTPRGVVIALTDLTEQMRVLEELAMAKEEAEEMDSAKGEFLAHMSHEIRTPLTGIIGMVQLTLETELLPEQRQCLTAAHESAQSLTRLLNDLLDLSKVAARKMEFEEKPFSLRECLRKATDLFLAQAVKKGLDLSFSVAENVTDLLLGDEGRLRQVLMNLIGNAIKFTNKGYIKVEVTAGQPSGITFRVTDSGIGIPESYRSRLFTTFSQADTSSTRRYGGTGLGLALSQQLVEAMGGAISVESEEGKGSSFFFTIPFRKVEKG